MTVQGELYMEFQAVNENSVQQNVDATRYPFWFPQIEIHKHKTSIGNLRFNLIFRSQNGGCTFKIKYHEMSPHN